MAVRPHYRCLSGDGASALRGAAEGATPVRAVLAEYEAAFAQATSVLREEPDEAPIESLLQRIRRAYLNKETS